MEYDSLQFASKCLKGAAGAMDVLYDTLRELVQEYDCYIPTSMVRAASGLRDDHFEDALMDWVGLGVVVERDDDLWMARAFRR